ncbi:hypothetical protein [Streptococcus lactarius]|uniref:Uncharacterized protein n=1 Tax=Streptococcus lactarius TaxID=684066 RepID=A0A9X0WLT3_9STRE|nr:hypothetical protein [Streptococcus lactarius]MBK4778875.1 hypothetical protein [Streptococcus lactarius]QUB39649.1 hypothetical protein J4854_04180 [Streptococcus lactarius]
MSLDDVHIPINEDEVLSIAQINNRLEIAVLSSIGKKYGYDPSFITDSYFDDLYDAVLPFNDIQDLKRIIDRIIEVEDNK